MTQHSMTVPNGSGAAVRGGLNDALQALASSSAGTSAPSTTFPHQIWADTTAGKIKMRNAANTAWVILGDIDAPMLHAILEDFTGLSPAADRFAYWTGASAMALATLTAFGRSLIDDADGAAAIATIGKATAANWRAGAADKIMTPDGLDSAAAIVTISDGATIGVDWSTFYTGEVTLGGNRTLDAPSSSVPGTKRKILVVQDGTGSRTLSFHANYKFPGGSAPTLSTGAGKVDVLEIFCKTTSLFHVHHALDVR